MRAYSTFEEMELPTHHVTPMDPVSRSGTMARVMQEMYISLSKS